ncbi:unnamed protein product [Cuscuta epithymum]|uniref:Mitochondrial protein n=1 Tax=Cuscuta epithymum TaxID=186058 RepID=A0AAV0EVD0_9ASTE|nr:unnamed protein product [Cuscuta epithymum]
MSFFSLYKALNSSSNDIPFHRLILSFYIFVLGIFFKFLRRKLQPPKSLVFRYLQGTSSHGLWLRDGQSISLIVSYSDADWAGCTDSCRSTTGYNIFLGGNLIPWHSKKQPTVSKSSTEAEYRAVAYKVLDTLFIRSLLLYMGIRISAPVQLFCDNVSTSNLAVNPISTIAASI